MICKVNENQNFIPENINFSKYVDISYSYRNDENHNIKECKKR